VRLRVFMGACLIALACILLAALRRGELELTVTVAASLVLLVLVAIGMIDLLRQRERSLARERLLGSFAAALVACATREEMEQTALELLVGLLEPPAVAVLCLIEEGSLAAVARSDKRHWRSPTLPKPLAITLLALADERAADVVTLEPALLGAMGLDEHSDRGLVLALAPAPHEGILGLLVLAYASEASRQALAALEALATQLALALERERLKRERHAWHSEARFAALVEHSSDLITVVAADATITYQSPSCEQILGYRPEDLIGTRFDRLVPPEDAGGLLRLLADGSAYARRDGQLIECTLRTRDGELRQFEVLPTNLLDDEHVRGIVLTARDINERKTFEEQLTHQAFHDPVTNLANRALFVERVRHAIGRARREQRELGVMFLDIDDFKSINDNLGHGAGDAALIDIAKRLSGSIRASDTAARFAGDEFVVLLEDLESTDVATEVAERVLEELRRPLVLAGKELVVRGSIGISIMDTSSTIGADELIRDADAAMYIAKRDGKGSYRMFEPEMHDGMLARLQLRSELQRALEAGEFELHYQPIIHLADGRVAGMEALLRWHHPDRGLVVPADFIPFAEETGLIVPIGRWVLREACLQAAAVQWMWTDDPPLYICVNLSVCQLQNGDVIADVRDALVESSLEPSLLMLEITESMLIEDPEVAIRRLEELRALGVRIAMDDFGTGYSSLSHLSRFPVDVIKMDRSFLGPGSQRDAADLSSAVVALGSSLSLQVVAEGIEFDDQLDRLRELGCELGQGFHFAHPMEAGHLIDYLAARPEHDGSERGQSLKPAPGEGT
jgi:diguanylate cyclase (GGDEF)-like protein/PAS domain S-box-containing protein